jgi:hypothetical protein
VLVESHSVDFAEDFLATEVAIMKRILMVAIVTLTLLSACAVHPVVDTRAPEVAAATQTARSKALPPVTIEPQVLPTVTPEPTATPPCDIKGNVNAKGEKIYFVHGQLDYVRTVIDPSKGEKFFCTESEAVADGFRKAKK